MKKISKRDLNKKALSGAKVVSLKPPRMTDEDIRKAILAETVRMKARHDADFGALAELMEGQSGDVARLYAEIQTLKTPRGGDIEMVVNRYHRTRLVRDIDVIRDNVRTAKIVFNRDSLGDVDRITIERQ